MLLDGDRTSGDDIRTQNVTAAMAIANIVKTSLGPVRPPPSLFSGPLHALSSVSFLSDLSRV